jgi:hypothetical protein
VSDGLKKRFGSGDLEIGDPKAAVSVVLFFDLGLIRVELGYMAHFKHSKGW